MTLQLPHVNRIGWWLAIGLPPLIFFVLFPDYIVKGTYFWVTILTLPFSLITDKKTPQFPFAFICFIVGVITIFMPTTIGMYVFVASLTLFIGQKKFGSIHPVGLVHLFLASPFFIYLSSLISFPIRLKLSSAVSFLLNNSGFINQLEGNIIIIGGSSFLVDQACSGMYLLGYGILFGTLIISGSTRLNNLSFYKMLLYYTILFSLIIWGNIVRIYLLVALQINETNWMHEATGLFIYLAQILLPFYFIVKFTNKKKRKAIPYQTERFPYKTYGALISLMVLLLIQVQTKKKEESVHNTQLSLDGYTTEIVKGGVTKLYNEEGLIYVKNPVTAYSSDHNPMICWSGSGFEFKELKKTNINGVLVNVASLVKGKETLHTGWWFESEEYQTGSQWEWRKISFRNSERFYLINVTCNSESELKSKIQELLKTEIIKG